MKQCMIQQVKDRKLRSILIAAAQKIESLIQSGQVTATTRLISTTPQGLTVLTTWERKNPEKPILFHFTYQLNLPVFKDWFAANKTITDGTLVIEKYGVVFTVESFAKVGGAAYHIDNGEGGVKYLPLEKGPVVFTMHRDIIAGQEWEVYLEEPVV